jgi:hypothetical protein
MTMTMYRSIVMVAFLVAAVMATTSDARLTTDAEKENARRLTNNSCADWEDLDKRCCGADLSSCTCPVREYNSGWGSSYIQSWWDSKCTTISGKVTECSNNAAP